MSGQAHCLSGRYFEIADIAKVSTSHVVDVAQPAALKQRTDTRIASLQSVAASETLRVNVPQAVGGKTVFGNLTVDRVTGAGFVTAYGCDDELQKDTRTIVTTTTTTTTTQPAVPGNPGDTKNCGDFATYTEAKAWFDTYYPYYGDVARLDGNDGDLIPCESLPGAP